MTHNDQIILQTYRYTFTPDVTEQLSIFAQIHQYDERKIFKESWKTWIEEDEIKPMIMTEVERLEQLGFTGDVLDKMFKSVRYYYRKKSNEPTVQPQRKVYESMSTAILLQMDEHINKQITEHVKEKQQFNNNIVSISKISPAKSFDNYCNENKDMILQMLKDQEDQHTITNQNVEDMINKLKKTYKNRFYTMRVLINNV
jgi:hypothetical protein